MASKRSISKWSVRVNVEIPRRLPAGPDAGAVAAMFGLADGPDETPWEDFPVEIAPGQIVVVAGPSGSGKSLLLAELARRVDGAVVLRTARLARCGKPAVEVLRGGTLAERLAMLARCGLAEAGVLVAPAARLSAGQRARLALAEALHGAFRSGRERLILADEFATGLDPTTAALLCRGVRRLIRGSPVALLAATPRPDVVRRLAPDRLIVKPLGGAAVVYERPVRPPADAAAAFRIRPGTIADYRRLGRFHYLAGPPAAHKRVWVACPTGRDRLARWRRAAIPPVAAVLVVSPPVPNVRGRNLATGGRYVACDPAAALRLLNAEVETISRVVVHPMFRGCGLAGRLVRHALATAGAPRVEALAAMGRIHPFLERAGMRPTVLPPSEPTARLLSAAEAVGLSPADVAAVGPVRRLLADGSRRAAFFRAELERYIAAEFSPARRVRLADPIAEACRRTARRYVYYLYDETNPNSDYSDF